MAIPFILTALAFSRMTTAFAVVKRHYAAIVAFGMHIAGAAVWLGGVILIAMGILILNGELFQINSEIQTWFEESGLDFYRHV